MPDILVRNVPAETLKRFKLRAKKNNRSLQQELKELLENHFSHPAVDIASRAAAIRKRLAAAGGRFSDSAVLMRRDRCR